MNPSVRSKTAVDGALPSMVSGQGPASAPSTFSGAAPPATRVDPPLPVSRSRRPGELFQDVLATLGKRRAWRVFEGGSAHTPEDYRCKSCRKSGGLFPKPHRPAQADCPGLLHFEAIATGKGSWAIRTRCDVCGRSLSSAD